MTAKNNECNQTARYPSQISLPETKGVFGSGMKWNGTELFRTYSQFMCLVVEKEWNQLVLLEGIYHLDAECTRSTESVLLEREANHH